MDCFPKKGFVGGLTKSLNIQKNRKIKNEIGVAVGEKAR